MIKQKTILQIWGAQSSGKSTTVKLIYEELTKRFIDPHHIYSLTSLPTHDITKVITCLKHKIGIKSMGDYLYAYGVKADLEGLIITEQCDLVICTSRVYNDVAKHIEMLASTNGYRLIKATNYRTKQSRALQDDLNIQSCQQICDIVHFILTGVI